MLCLPSSATVRRAGVALALGIFLLPPTGRADLRGVFVDGEMAEWQGLAPSAIDPAGDGGTIDLGSIWLANDQDRFFIRLETGGEIQPDERIAGFDRRAFGHVNPFYDTAFQVLDDLYLSLRNDFALRYRHFVEAGEVGPDQEHRQQDHHRPGDRTPIG